jgi:hypothetical protein
MAPGEERPSPQPAARVYKDLVLRPATAFRAVRDDPLKTALVRYGILILVMFLAGVLLAYARYPYLVAQYGSSSVQPFASLYGPTFAQYLVFFSAGVFAFSLLYHLLVWAAGGRDGYGRTLSLFLYALSPLVAGSMMAESFVNAGLTIFIGLLPLLVLWSSALLVIGTRESHGLSTGRAALPVLVIALMACVALLALASLPPPPCEGPGCG